MISYIGSRRNRAPWWTDEDWSSTQHVNNSVLPDYHKAKVDADECLTALAAQRSDFDAIVLRPGTLEDGEKDGKVALGKITARGKVKRADVADVAFRLLEEEGAKGWVDLLAGEEETSKAVRRIVEEKVDCVEGEDVEGIVAKYKL